MTGHTAAVREVRERCTVSVHLSCTSGPPPAGSAPMAVRSALFAIERYVSVGGRPVAEEELPSLWGYHLDLDLSGTSEGEWQPDDPEDFRHAWSPAGRWIASAKSVNRDGQRAVSMSAAAESVHRGEWRVVGQGELLPGRGTGTPMFNYLGSAGWLAMDALEVVGGGSIVVRHEPRHGTGLVLVALGSFDPSGSSHFLLTAATIETIAYALMYDSDPTLLVGRDQYDSRHQFDNPFRSGRLGAAVIGIDNGSAWTAAYCNGSWRGAGKTRQGVDPDQTYELSVSSGPRSSTRIVEVCLWQGGVDRARIRNQIATAVAYYEGRRP